MTTEQLAARAGFKRIGLDGAIQQITWMVGADGLAYTVINRNSERAADRRSYDAVRESEKVRKVLTEEKRRRTKR